MRDSLWVKFERWATVAMFATTLGVSGTLLYGQWQESRQQTGLRPAEPAKPLLAAGDKLEVWAEAGDDRAKGIVLFLSSTCKYCAENGSFYEQLSAAFQQSGGRLLAVFSPNDRDAEAFLQRHRIRVDKLIRLDAARAPISGVPTTVAVNADGTVKQVWRGVIRPNDRTQILKLTASTAH